MTIKGTSFFLNRTFFYRKGRLWMGSIMTWLDWNKRLMFQLVNVFFCYFVLFSVSWLSMGSVGKLIEVIIYTSIKSFLYYLRTNYVRVLCFNAGGGGYCLLHIVGPNIKNYFLKNFEVWEFPVETYVLVVILSLGLR